jgi:hypothetical protein
MLLSRFFDGLREAGRRLSITAGAGECVISGVTRAAGDADRFAQAYKGLRADPSVQFTLVAPERRPKPPAWLEALGRFLREYIFSPIGKALKWVGSFFPDAPYARIFLWGVLALAALLLLWAIYNRVRHGEWRVRLPRRAAAQAIPDDEDWAPGEMPVRSWLEEADALAREGRYAEAIHHLLFRSIEDIANRRPNLVRPALTSREIAGSQGIPARARELFARIARMVERSLFGGRPVGESDWIEARGAYSDFAVAGAWRA